MVGVSAVWIGCVSMVLAQADDGAGDEAATSESRPHGGLFVWKDSPGTRNPGNGQYLSPASVFPKKQGQRDFSQRLLHSQYRVSPADGVELWSGTFVFYPPLVWTGGAHYAWALQPNLHLGVGASVVGFLGLGRWLDGYALEREDTQIASWTRVSVTAGDADRHVTLGTGFGQLRDLQGTQPASFVPVQIAGQLRVSERLAVVGESWLFLSPETLASAHPLQSCEFAIFGGTARLFRARSTAEHPRRKSFDPGGQPRTTLDIGLMFLARRAHYFYFDGESEYTNISLETGIPWIAWTRHSRAKAVLSPDEFLEDLGEEHP